MTNRKPKFPEAERLRGNEVPRAKPLPPTDGAIFRPEISVSQTIMLLLWLYRRFGRRDDRLFLVVLCFFLGIGHYISLPLFPSQMVPVNPEFVCPHADGN